MLTKKVVTLAFCLSLPACVAPPAITMASFALSGVSFIQSGKTLPDHALSSVAQRDCKILRATRGELICQAEAAPNLDQSISLAAVPAGTTWPKEIAALPVPSAPIVEPTAASIHPVVDTSFVPIPAPTPVNTPVLRPISAPAFDQVLGVRPASAEADKVIRRPASANIRNVSEVPKASRQIAATVTRENQLHTHALVPKVQKSDSSRHLVVGSFRDRTRATLLITRLGNDGLRIFMSKVDGRVQHRVVAGPYPAADLPAAKRNLAARGIKGMWPIKLFETSNGFQTAAR